MCRLMRPMLQMWQRHEEDIAFTCLSTARIVSRFAPNLFPECAPWTVLSLTWSWISSLTFSSYSGLKIATCVFSWFTINILVCIQALASDKRVSSSAEAPAHDVYLHDVHMSLLSGAPTRKICVCCRDSGTDGLFSVTRSSWSSCTVSITTAIHWH